MLDAVKTHLKHPEGENENVAKMAKMPKSAVYTAMRALMVSWRAIGPRILGKKNTTCWLVAIHCMGTRGGHLATFLFMYLFSSARRKIRKRDNATISLLNR